MKRYILLAFLILLFIEIYSVFPPHLPKKPSSTPSQKYLQGVLHVHSEYSYDAHGSVAELAKTAKEVGMDFVVLTDHNTAKARHLGLEKNYDGVDVFVEMEVSTPAGHILSYFSHTSARDLNDLQVVDLTWLHYQGKESRPDMFTIIAHPSSPKTPWTRLDRYPEGIEIVNFDSAWQRQAYNSKLAFATTTTLIPFNRFLASLRFFQVYEKNLSIWDGMNAISPGHFATLGHDTHQRLILRSGWELHWPDYLSTFKLASVLVYVPFPLPEDFEERKKLIYENIRKGKMVIAFQSLFPVEGSDWILRCKDQILYHAGSEVTLSPDCQFEVTLPKNFPYQGTVRLIKDGDLYKEVPFNKSRTEIPLNSVGTYRLEVWVDSNTLFSILQNRKVPYLFYNPIYVR